MIKTLSSHYKIIPWLSDSSAVVPEKYILNIYTWSGLKENEPTTPSYQIENINPLGVTGAKDIDISDYIKGSVPNDLNTYNTTSVNDANSLVWVKTEVIYYIDGIPTDPEHGKIDIATNGYGYALEGINPTVPSDGYLATKIEQKVNINGSYIFCFLSDETEDTVIRLNDLEFTVSPTTDSSKLAQLCYINVSEFDTDYIEIYKDDILMTTLLITNEDSFDPLDIVFINKEGQEQTITFFKEKRDTLDIEKETYEGYNSRPLEGNHRFKTYNANGRDSFTMNSGFVKEDNNELFTQLLLSEKVWNLKDGIYIPLNLGTEKIEYKTLYKDRLLNYKIDFKYSFNKI